MIRKPLDERMHSLITSKTEEYRRFKALDAATGIPSDTWKSWYHGRQRPTAEMIEAVCKRWPEHAFWLSTGITDEKHGHDASDMHPDFRSRTAARKLFLAAIQLAELEATTGITVESLEREIEGEELGVDPAQMRTWRRLFEQMIQLAEIRDEQEISLSKHESTDFQERFLK